MVLSTVANYSKQIIATKPTLLHSKSVFKQIAYKFITINFGGEGEATHRW
jgi:hypothetical protein